MWHHIRTEHPKARKDYPCGAFPYLDYDLPYYREKMTDRENKILDRAISEGCMIRKNDIYTKHVGTYEGEICDNKCRTDLDRICEKYDAYNLE